MTQKTDLNTHLNPDLEVIDDNKSRWNLPATRRHGFQNLYRLTRYGMSFRSDTVLTLDRKTDPRIGAEPELQRLTSTSHFCGMAVIRNQTLIYEKYAADFGPDHPHTIMSISKMTINLIIGELIAAGKIKLDATVATYLPEIGSGYASATVQQVLNMDLENSFQEDYLDPESESFYQEAAIGWRLPAPTVPEQSQKSFLAGINALPSGDLSNTTGYALYKSANTDVLGWICERVSGKPLRQWILEIVEAVGIEGTWFMHTDRDGFPIVDGGVNLTARDLARFGQLFARRGQGVAGRQIGNAAFIEKTRSNPGPQLPPPEDFYRYSNQTMTNGTWVGHGGYGGQFMLADLDTGVSVSFFSVLENKDAEDLIYSAEMVRMMEHIAATFG